MNWYLLGLTPMTGILVAIAVVVAGFIVGLLKSQSAWTLGGLLGLVSSPLTFGAIGLGTIIALVIEPTALVLIIGAIAGAVVLVIKALSDKQIAAIQAVGGTAKVIEGHVNSAATRDLTVIDAKNKEIETLTAQLSEAKAIASARAATDAAVAVAAAAAAPAAPVSTAVPSALTPVLKSIDQNTKETAKNTERTEAVVQDLKDAKP